MCVCAALELHGGLHPLLDNFFDSLCLMIYLNTRFILIHSFWNVKILLLGNAHRTRLFHDPFGSVGAAEAPQRRAYQCDCRAREAPGSGAGKHVENVVVADFAFGEGQAKVPQHVAAGEKRHSEPRRQPQQPGPLQGLVVASAEAPQERRHHSKHDPVDQRRRRKVTENRLESKVSWQSLEELEHGSMSVLRKVWWLWASEFFFWRSKVEAIDYRFHALKQKKRLLTISESSHCQSGAVIAWK